MADKNGMEDTDDTLKLEAEHLVQEVAYAVHDIQLSPVLGASDKLVYINLTTKEKESFCVQLTAQGFKMLPGSIMVGGKVGSSREKPRTVYRRGSQHLILTHRIVGKEYDKVDEKYSGDNQCCETLYSLLDKVSPQYRLSFGNALFQKLETLKNQPSDGEDG